MTDRLAWLSLYHTLLTSGSLKLLFLAVTLWFGGKFATVLLQFALKRKLQDTVECKI